MLRAPRGAQLAWRDQAAEARLRLRRTIGPTAQAALAAALAWVLAHDALGHAQPFFAPIAAAIALGTSGIRRGRRIIQMVFGVTLGIAVGEGAQALVGTGPWAIGIAVLATLMAAVVTGVGVFGEGMMFANQSAASAVLVVALHRHGTGSERLVDALVGGGVAAVIGVGLFPAHPLRVLHDAEQQVLRALAGALAHVAGLLRAATPPAAGWTLAATQDVHERLADLAQARLTARANVRVAPRRRRLGAAVAVELERTAHLELLAGAVLSLIRAAGDGLEDGNVLPADGADALAATLATMARGPIPWPPRVLAQAREGARSTITAAAGQGPLAPLVRRAGRDVLLVLPDS